MARPHLCLAVLALTLAGCGATGGTEPGKASSGTETKTTVASSTVPDTTGTTAVDGPAADDNPTIDELAELLPSAADLGEDWSEVETTFGSDSDDDDDTAALFEAQCPELAEVAVGGQDEDDEVTRTFESTDDTSFEVGLQVNSQPLSDAKLDEIVDALGDCTNLTYTEDGADVTMNLTAERADELGDRGARMTIEATIESTQLPAPIEMSVHMLVFVRDSVGVMVSATPGLDPETFEKIDFDLALVDDVAAAIDEDLDALVGG